MAIKFSKGRNDFCFNQSIGLVTKGHIWSHALAKIVFLTFPRNKRFKTILNNQIGLYSQRQWIATSLSQPTCVIGHV